MMNSPNSPSDKPTILRIISRLNIGGSALHTILLTEAMADCGYRSVLVVGREEAEEGNMIEQARARGIEPVVIEEMRRSIHPIRDVRAFLKLREIIVRERPVLVETHTAKAGILGRLAARFMKVPVIVHVFHGHVLRKYFGRLKSDFFTWLERKLACLSDVVIMVSRKGREELISFGVAPPEKILYMPYGLDLDAFRDYPKDRAPLKEEFKVPSDCVLVGIVGRLVPIKGHVDFLEAARIVGEKREKVAFMIVGDGELREELEQAVRRLSIRDRVYFAGWRHDLQAVYGSLDIVVQTSYNEGMPFALMEAMAAGKPVVSTDVGGVPDLVVDGVTGLLAPERDPEAVADRMLRLVDDPEFTEALSKRGQEFALQRHSKARLLEDMLDFYDELLREKGIEPPARNESLGLAQ